MTFIHHIASGLQCSALTATSQPVWRMNTVCVCVCPAFLKWELLGVEPVVILLNSSWLSHLVFKIPTYYPGVAARDWGNNRKKNKTVMQAHLHSGAPVRLACHPPTTLFQVFTTRTVFFFFNCDVSFHNYPLWQSKGEILEMCSWSPWQWSTHTLSLNFQFKMWHPSQWQLGCCSPVSCV